MSDYHVVKHAVGVVRVQSLGRSHFAPTLLTSVKLIADFTRVKRCTVEYTPVQRRLCRTYQSAFLPISLLYRYHIPLFRVTRLHAGSKDLK